MAHIRIGENAQSEAERVTDAQSHAVDAMDAVDAVDAVVV